MRVPDDVQGYFKLSDHPDLFVAETAEMLFAGVARAVRLCTHCDRDRHGEKQCRGRMLDCPFSTSKMREADAVLAARARELLVKYVELLEKQKAQEQSAPEPISGQFQLML